MLPTNSRPTSETPEEFWDNWLWCSWADRETGYQRSVTVSIYQATDGEREVDGVRDMMRDECSERAESTDSELGGLRDHRPAASPTWCRAECE